MATKKETVKKKYKQVEVRRIQTVRSGKVYTHFELHKELRKGVLLDPQRGDADVINRGVLVNGDNTFFTIYVPEEFNKTEFVLDDVLPEELIPEDWLSGKA